MFGIVQLPLSYIPCTKSQNVNNAAGEHLYKQDVSIDIVNSDPD